MKRFAILIMLVLGAAASACGGVSGPVVSASLREPNPGSETLQVSIGGLVDGHFQDTQVFQGFGCTGGNRSPAIQWSGAPDGTRGYAIIIHDPDAPTGVGFFHWVVLDIPASISSLGENASETGMPEGVIQAYTDFGSNVYGGPCPPPGAPHRYEVTVYALDVPALGLPANATGALTRFLLRQHTLALGRASATYGR